MNTCTDYNVWNELKKKIEIQSVPTIKYPKEGEVWMSSLGINVGFEQNGSGKNFSRPMLIVKKFNNVMFWCVPLSTKQKDKDFYFNFTDVYGLNVSVIVAQIRLTSVKRLRRKLYCMNETVFNDVKEKIRSLI